MSAVDVSSVTPEVLAQIEAIVSVGLAVLLIYSLRRSFKDIAAALGYGSDVERDAARLRLVGEDVEARDGAIYTREAIEAMDAETAARSMGFEPAQAASAPVEDDFEKMERIAEWQRVEGAHSVDLYEKLVDRGMDEDAAMSAVNARHAAVDAQFEKRYSDSAHAQAVMLSKEDRKHDEFISGGGDQMPDAVEQRPLSKFDVYEHQIAGGFSHDAAMRAADRWELEQRQADFEAKL